MLVSILDVKNYAKISLLGLLLYADVLLVARLPLLYIYCIRDFYCVVVVTGVCTLMVNHSLV